MESDFLAGSGKSLCHRYVRPARMGAAKRLRTVIETNTQDAVMSTSDVESELCLLRQRNEELQSELDALKLQIGSQNCKRNSNDQSSNGRSPRRISTPLYYQHASCEKSFRNDEYDSPKKTSALSQTQKAICPLNENSNNPPGTAKSKPTIMPEISEVAASKHSPSSGNSKQVLDLDEENYIRPLASNESNEESESESVELIHDDSSHNKHQNRRRVRHTRHIEPFWHDIKERAGWLIGLLFLQSCSSFIIQYNERFLQGHMVIVQFLTMLVGAGGNAGNQASVRVIRGLAVGTLNDRTRDAFLKKEIKMAFGLSVLLGFTGCVRAALFRTPAGETVAVTTSLCAIVLISVGIGNMLPLGMKKVGIDPAHSSTTIQVVMDIMGVLITVCVSSFILSFRVFQHDDSAKAGDNTTT